jgi:hypothetical protein
MLLPNRSSEDFDLDDVLQGIGFAMLFAFLAIFAKLVFPVALLKPEWQLQVGEALRGTASIPLAGMALLLLAEFINPDSQILAERIVWLRRLSVVAALGFFLLIPLQISAGLRQISQYTVTEYRELRAIQRASAAIEQAVTPQEMFNAIKLMPGLPDDIVPTFTLPIPAIRTALLAQIRPQVLKLETRIRQVRTQRLQAAITIFSFDAFISLAYGIGFAAIGRTAVQSPTLLQQIILIPSYLRLRIIFYGEALLSLPSLLPRFRLPRLRLPDFYFPPPRFLFRPLRFPFRPLRFSLKPHRRRSRHRRPWFRFPFLRLPGSRRSSNRPDFIPEEWLDSPDQDSDHPF